MIAITLPTLNQKIVTAERDLREIENDTDPTITGKMNYQHYQTPRGRGNGRYRGYGRGGGRSGYVVGSLCVYSPLEYYY